jgi:Transmembrane domain of unknown function (DUF3566)
VTSPNEPGAHQKGDSANGDGSADRSAGAHRAGSPAESFTPDLADSPPWQRAASRPSQTGAPTARPTESHTETRSAPSGADARLNRFISGTSAPGGAQPKNNPTQELEPVPSRPESPPSEAYASELPDLSGGIPRTPPRKPAPERSSEASGAGGTFGSGRSATEAREAREARESRTQVSRRTRGPVRASMQIRRIDPWSTLKVSLMLSVALFFVWMIAIAFLYLVLGGMGVWAKLNSNVGDLLNNTSGSSGELVSSGTIFGGAVLIGLVNIVLITSMATIAAFVYNLTTDLIGGIEVTLADRD